MFSSKSYLEKKTGPYGIGRFSYMQSLVNEYQSADSIDSKLQVMGNLANFAYDPINYEYMQALNVTDLFLDGLEETEEKLVEFAIGGICNACNDMENKKHIIDSDGIKLIIKCLSQPSEEIVISAITTLIFLFSPETKSEITAVPVVECMLRLSDSSNQRIKTLATIFVTDHCDQETIHQAREAQKQMNQMLNSLPS